MTTKKDTPPSADPRAGRNAGYAENQPRDKADAHAPAPDPKPNPDEPGIDRDTDDTPDLAREDDSKKP